MSLSKFKQDALIQEVLCQIENDVRDQDTDAIYAMLMQCDHRAMQHYLPESSCEHLNFQILE